MEIWQLILIIITLTWTYITIKRKHMSDIEFYFYFPCFILSLVSIVCSIDWSFLIYKLW